MPFCFSSFFFFFPLTSQSLLACYPLVSNRQALSTSPSWREGRGTVFSPKFMGGKPAKTQGSTPQEDANKPITEGLFLTPTSPFLLFSPCTLSLSLALAVTAWIGSRRLLLISLFSLSPNTPGPWPGARAAPGPWQSWGCEFSIQRAESLNPLLGDRWIIRNFICWAGNK